MEKLTPNQLAEKFDAVRNGASRMKVARRNLYSTRGNHSYVRFAAYDSLMNSPSSLKDSSFTFRTEAGAAKAAMEWEQELS